MCGTTPLEKSHYEIMTLKITLKMHFYTEKTHFQCDFQCHNFIVSNCGVTGLCPTIICSSHNKCSFWCKSRNRGCEFATHLHFNPVGQRLNGHDRFTLCQRAGTAARLVYAAVNGHLELTLLKVGQRFDAISTSNLEVNKFRDR